MPKLLVVMWSLFYSFQSVYPAPACSLINSFKPDFQAEGDFIISGIFPMHYRVEPPDQTFTFKTEAPQCWGFDRRSFRWAQTMRLAVEEINQRQDLLPNFTLGYKIYDSCTTPMTAQAAVLMVLNGPVEASSSGICSGASPLLAVIGESGSAQSIVLSRTLQPFRIPMISYFSTCSCLSNRKEFPTFFRTLPNDNYQVKAIARLLQKFGWTWVGVILEDHDYGRFALQGLIREIENTGVCLAYHEMIPKVYNRERIQEILKTMKYSSARVVVVFTGEGELYPFLKDYMEGNITGMQWIASEAWVTASLFTGREFYPFLGGTIGFAIRQGQIPGLRDYLRNVNPLRYPSNPLVHELWGALYGCSLYPSSNRTQDSSQLPPCSGKEPLQEQHSAYLNTSSPRVSYNVYKAVYAVAHSMQKLISCEPGKGPFLNSACGDAKNIQPWQLQHYLQEVSFSISGEEVKFDANGDVVPSYDVINWQKGPAGNIEFVNVGRFYGANDPGRELYIEEEAIVWTGDQREASCTQCAFQYMRCHLLKFCRVTWSNNDRFTFTNMLLAVSLFLVIYNISNCSKKSITVYAFARCREVLVSTCSESCAPGTRKAVRHGQPLCCFDCSPCDSGKISNKTDSIDCTSCPEDYWSNPARTDCIPKVTEYLSHDAIGLSLTVIATAGACLTISVLAVFLYHRNTPIVKVNNSELSFFILLSLTLCFLCALLFIGEPTSWSCMLRHTAFSITFSLCIACILGKTFVVLAAFTANRPGNKIKKWLGPKQQRCIISACTFVQVIICAVWLITAPPFPNKNTQYYRSRIILECSVGSNLAFWCVLGYIGIQAALCFFLAFLARKLPGNFNEAKYITFSMLIFCTVWLAFIPAYVSSPGRFTVAVEIFAILASSFGLLLCLFAPKCHIILLKPEKNTKHYLMGRSTAK